MIHFVHVVHVHLDPQRIAALARFIFWAFASWLAWHFLPDAWPAATTWLGQLCATVLAPVAWIFDAVGGMLRFLAMAQMVLLPVLALVLGVAVGMGQLEHASVLWLGAAGLNAAWALFLGYPVLAGIVLAGSVAVLWAAVAAQLPSPGWTDLLAVTLAAGLAAWGTVRYGTAFAPVCWLLVPLSWGCLALGAACGVQRRFGGWLRDPGMVRLLMLAVVLVMAVTAPFGGDVARAAGLLPQTAAPARAQPAAAIVMSVPVTQDVVGGALPSRQPGPAGSPRGYARLGKPAIASPRVLPRT